jgi:hypothetical protein
MFAPRWGGVARDLCRPSRRARQFRIIVCDTLGATMRKILFAVLSFAFFFSGSSAATRIDDPAAFVKSVYATTVGKHPEPEDIYTPRLKALFDLDRKEAGGEVGRWDMDFWMNGQDGTIGDVHVTKKDVENSADREIVIATFKNGKLPCEIHFYFEKTAQGWKLEDARSTIGDPWVLSLQLKYGYDGKQ